MGQNTDFHPRRGPINEPTTSNLRGHSFVETDPPTGELRFVAEFEPMQGVTIRYPLGIPESLVADFTHNCQVYCIVSDSCENEAFQTFVDAGVDMNRVTFVNAPTESFFVRDYGPWYIFEDEHPAIVDSRYYPGIRPQDDSISCVFSQFWNIPLYGMDLQYEGGNIMQDGRGHGVSDDFVLWMNNDDEENLRNKMRDYLGLDSLHLVHSNYYPHVDCFGKYLAPDKILISRAPENDPRYADFEEIANYFANTDCCWGYPYRVYRVDIPGSGNNTLAPYTNSLILNKTVYLPMGNDSTYNQNAVSVYQEAMPGYEIVAVESCENTPWIPGDALHCRTRGVMDFDMLFVDHRDVWHGEQEWRYSYPVKSKFIAYSGEPLKTDSLLVYYRIDGGPYQVAHMTPTSNPDEYVGFITGFQSGSEIDYYVFGADESGHRYTQPAFAELEPHHFTVGPHEPPIGELFVTYDTVWVYDSEPGHYNYFYLVNYTSQNVLVSDIELDNEFLVLEMNHTLPFTLAPGQQCYIEVLHYQYFSKDFEPEELRIVTSLGDLTVVVMVKDNMDNYGLIVSGFGSNTFYLTMEEPEKDVVLVNANYSSQWPCTIDGFRLYYTLDLVEIDSDILEISTDLPLPCTLNVGEELKLHLKPNNSASIFDKFSGNDFLEIWVSIVSNFDEIFHLNVFLESCFLTSVPEQTMEPQLYPNPTTGLFTVKGADIARVEVYNLVGEKVFEVESGKWKVENCLDASGWNKGIYLVSITKQNGAVETRKLVVK